MFTSGGTQSNLHALLPRSRSRRSRGRSSRVRGRSARLVVFATASSHFSVGKSALLLGLSDDAVIAVADDGEGRMDAAALAVALREAEASGRLPMAVVATAGTTDRGVHRPARVDRGRVRRGRRMAARRCGVRVRAARLTASPAPARRDRAGAIGHRRLPQELLPAGVVERAAGARAATTSRRGAWHADYLNPLENEEPNQVDVSLQTTRRFDALKLWVDAPRRSAPSGLGRDVRHRHRPRAQRVQRRGRRPIPNSSSSAGRS